MGAIRSAGVAVAGELTSTDPEWQRLWFTLQGRPWSSLAVIGTDASTDADRVARTLAAVGRRDGQIPVEVVTGLGVSFQDVPRIVNQVTHASTDKLLLVSCDPLRRNPAMIPLLQAVSGVVLVVRLGESRMDSVQKTIDAVGRDRLVATISVG